MRKTLLLLCVSLVGVCAQADTVYYQDSNAWMDAAKAVNKDVAYATPSFNDGVPGNAGSMTYPDGFVLQDTINGDQAGDAVAANGQVSGSLNPTEMVYVSNIEDRFPGKIYRLLGIGTDVVIPSGPEVTVGWNDGNAPKLSDYTGFTGFIIPTKDYNPNKSIFTRLQLADGIQTNYTISDLMFAFVPYTPPPTNTPEPGTIGLLSIAAIAVLGIRLRG